MMARLTLKQQQAEIDGMWEHVNNNESRLDLLERRVDILVRTVADLDADLDAALPTACRPTPADALEAVPVAGAGWSTNGEEPLEPLPTTSLWKSVKRAFFS